MNKQEEGRNSNEGLVLVVVALIIVSSAFYVATQLLNPNEVTLDGMKIRSSGDVQQGIRAALSGGAVVIEEYTTALNSTQNSGVAMMGAEVAYAAATMGKKVYAYELVDNGEKIGCSENNSYCSNPNVIIGYEGPNGFEGMIVNERIEIYGDPDFMFNNSVVVRGLIRMALSS